MVLESDQQERLLAEIKEIIKNQGCPDEIHQIRRDVAFLKEHSEFYWACKLLNAAREKRRSLLQSESASTKEWWQSESTQDDVWIIQQQALCTYKDEELPPRKRFEQAITLLEQIGLRNHDNKNVETLCLGGAVYKRKWQKFGQLEDLYESLFFYRSAFERNPRQDMGYGGVNAAFILDLLGNRANSIAKRSGTSSESKEVSYFREQAHELRQ